MNNRWKRFAAGFENLWSRFRGSSAAEHPFICFQPGLVSCLLNNMVVSKNRQRSAAAGKTASVRENAGSPCSRRTDGADSCQENQTPQRNYGRRWQVEKTRKRRKTWQINMQQNIFSFLSLHRDMHESLEITCLLRFGDLFIYCDDFFLALQ